MLKELIARLRQGHRTIPYPEGEAVLPDRFRGRPELDPAAGEEAGRAAAEACPTGAVGLEAGGPRLDLGRCLFCPDCAASGLVRFGQEHRLCAWSREELVLRRPQPPPAPPPGGDRLGLFRRSLALRQVSAGGCNGCEVDVNVLSTIAFDLGRFGIQVVASPRHADGLLITGPVTANMRLALEKSYLAVPPPRIVIAVGACAISGGPYLGHPEAHDGVAGILPVDLFIPGCPPHPLTILDGLLRLTGRVG